MDIKLKKLKTFSTNAGIGGRGRIFQIEGSLFIRSNGGDNANDRLICLENGNRFVDDNSIPSHAVDVTNEYKVVPV